MKTIKIGIIGFGTVGTGVIKALQNKKNLLSKKTGAKLVIKKICDVNLRRKRSISVDRRLLTRNPYDILNDPEIQIVVELVGGIHPAKELILKAFKNKKHVVTANKALLAEKGEEVFKNAKRAGVDLYFEAAVGGCIPIIKLLRESLAGNNVDTILGIVNGTSNYILSSMQKDNLSFKEALSKAQKYGFAEKNPSLDISGFDAGHKLAIISLLAFGKRIPINDIYVEGIKDISQNDIKYAQGLGYNIKPLAIAKYRQGGLEVRIQPTLLSKEHVLANINGVYNAIYIHSDLAGGTLFYGRGAGQSPAASSVISDIIDVARNIVNNCVGRIPIYVPNKNIKRIKSLQGIESRYYLRFSVIDKPGVLARISGILGKNHISISSVMQKERKYAKIVPVVIMTHEAKEKNMQKALSRIDKIGMVKRKTVAIRVER